MGKITLTVLLIFLFFVSLALLFIATYFGYMVIVSFINFEILVAAMFFIGMLISYGSIYLPLYYLVLLIIRFKR